MSPKTPIKDKNGVKIGFTTAKKTPRASQLPAEALVGARIREIRTQSGLDIEEVVGAEQVKHQYTQHGREGENFPFGRHLAAVIPGFGSPDQCLF